MRITIMAIGTRGDAQPAIALGRALQAVGHHVRILASAGFKTWIESHGLEAATSNIDVRALMESEGGADWAERGTNQVEQMRIMQRLFNQVGFDMMLDAWRASYDAEVVISSFTSDVYATAIVEKLGARHISMLMQPPLLATRSGAALLNAPLPNHTTILNYWFGKALLEPAMWRWFGEATNRFRREVLGLAHQTPSENRAALNRRLIVLGHSRHVVPHPPDWPPNVHTTGYWFLDEATDWMPPSDLLHFIEQGPPPVCVGFGSMVGRQPDRVTRLLVDAIIQSGQRAVLLSGWAGMNSSSLPPTIYGLDAAPHDWLFPHMAAVVHHGGAGTTAAGLRAGAPTVIVPHLGDQVFWGQRVEALGVGPRAIPRPKLTVSGLAQAIRVAATDPAMRQRARDLATHIREEDGLALAIDVIQRHLRV